MQAASRRQIGSRLAGRTASGSVALKFPREMADSWAMRSPGSRGVAIVLTVLAVMSGAPTARADVYRWVDHRGNVHFSAGAASVPARYRSSAERVPDMPGRSAEPEPVTPPKASGGVGSPVEPAPDIPGITRIRYRPGGQILAQVRVNGRGPIVLMVDTGADVTLITSRGLARLGLDLKPIATGQIRGVAGSAAAHGVRVQSVEVGAARVGPMNVVVYDMDFRDGDGLLGRDFLSHFTVQVNPAAGIVTLTSP